MQLDKKKTALILIGSVGVILLLGGRKAGATGYAKGDVNGDGFIDVVDFIHAQNIANEDPMPGGAAYPADWKARADINSDGYVSAGDLQALQDMIIGTV